MIQVAGDQKLGIGLYTPNEAAYYARIPTQTLTRWLYGNSVSENVYRPQLKDSDDRTVTFIDFIQALAVRALRQHDKKIPLRQIKQAVNRLYDEYGVEYPLAMRHRLYLFGKEVLIELDGHPDKPIEQLTGKMRRQTIMREVAEPFLEDITFNQEGYAEMYVPFTHQERKIIMDPRTRLGQPYLSESGYTFQTLLDAYQSEGSVLSAAKSFGVDKAEIMFAIRYADILRRNEAA